jgi:anti-sigma B factor antagonist
MEIKAEQREKVTIVIPIGDIDALTAKEVAAFLDSQLREGENQLVADLSQVGYMSSAGLRALLATLKEARHQGGDFRLAAVQDTVQQVLDMSGFSGIFQIFPTVEEALASFGG